MRYIQGDTKHLIPLKLEILFVSLLNVTYHHIHIHIAMPFTLFLSILGVYMYCV